MKLINGKIGSNYTVSGFELERTIERRLEALGLTQGKLLVILNNRKNGSVIFKVRGTRLAVGKKIAKSIQIEEVVA